MAGGVLPVAMFFLRVVLNGEKKNMYFTQSLNSEAYFGGPGSFWNTPKKA